MDLYTAIAEVRSRIGETMPDFWTDDEIIRSLNEGLRRFSQEEKWPWLYTVATGSQSAGDDTMTLHSNVSFPRQFNLVLTPTGSEPYMPTRVTPFEGTRLRVETRTTGDPQYYYLENTDTSGANKTITIRFVPTPSSGLYVEYIYIRNPMVLAADEDELDVPEEYVGAVVAWATAQCWLKELNWNQKATEQFQLYATVLDAARRDHRRIAVDENMAWGGGPVQPGPMPAFRLPPTLGPA